MSTPNILSIAGSDPSGGAGIQADLKTFAALECYGMAALAGLTAQNTQGVTAVEPVSADFLRAQLQAIFSDIRVDAVKIGMLGQPDIVQVVADMLQQYCTGVPVVLDPVMVATSGDRLLPEESIQTLKETLIPMATLVTPNIQEAQILLRKAVLDTERSALELSDMLGVAVMLKGGHLKGAQAIDVLALDGEAIAFEAPRVDTQNTHGTGCTLSSAIAALLAHGVDLPAAVGAAKEYLTGALKLSGDLDVGSGHGPVQHFWELWERDE